MGKTLALIKTVDLKGQKPWEVLIENMSAGQNGFEIVFSVIVSDRRGEHLRLKLSFCKTVLVEV